MLLQSLKLTQNYHMFTKKTNKNLFIILLRSIFAKYNG